MAKKTKKAVETEITLPESISIAGEIYSIEYLDKIEFDGTNGFLFGLSVYPNRSIKVATKDLNGDPLSASQIETTLWHEVAHMILFAGQYNKLGQNEALVEWLGRCIKDITLSIQENGNLKF